MVVSHMIRLSLFYQGTIMIKNTILLSFVMTSFLVQAADGAGAYNGAGPGNGMALVPGNKTNLRAQRMALVKPNSRRSAIPLVSEHAVTAETPKEGTRKSVDLSALTAIALHKPQAGGRVTRLSVVKSEPVTKILVKTTDNETADSQLSLDEIIADAVQDQQQREEAFIRALEAGPDSSFKKRLNAAVEEELRKDTANPESA